MGSGEEAGHSGRASPGQAMLIQGTGTQGQVSGVIGAIRDAAAATGTKFQYLLATAQVESGLNPHAAASGSSAGGLFQFIDQTWLTTLKEAGPALGYGSYANAIKQLPSGRYEVVDPSMRQRIMALRNDPTANAAMAGAFTRANAQQLTQRIGRAPSDGELYIAHFLGPSGASRLISLASNNPQASAANAFPGAARANRSIFYDRQGHARTTAQVYGVLVGRYQTAAARTAPGVAPVASAALVPPSAVAPASGTSASNTISPTSAAVSGPGVPSRNPNYAQTFTRTASVAPTAQAPVVAPVNASSSAVPPRGYRSLFSDTDRAPVSQVVRDLWSTRPSVAAALTGQTNYAPVPIPATNPAGAPLDLFGDRPADARALFTVGS